MSAAPVFSRWPRRLLLAVFLLGHFLLTGAYSVWNPLGEAPDEADHWAYIVYLAQERRLPEGPRVTQSKHPPLYHATAAAVASLAEPAFDFLRANPDVSLWPVENWSPNFFVHTTPESWPWTGGSLAFHLARLWSVLLSTATVAATYALARTAFPARPGLALVIAGVLAFLPEPAFIGGSANNDNAAALLGALALWGALAIYQAGGDWRAGWWTPLALGLGLLAKVSTSALWPVVALAIVLGCARRMNAATERPGSWLSALAHSWRQWTRAGLWVFVPALLIASPWLVRNWQLYGDPLGMELVRQTVDARTTPWGWADTAWLLQGWFVSFWGKFGGAGHIPMPGWVYALLALLSLASLLGLVRLVFWRSRVTAWRSEGSSASAGHVLGGDEGSRLREMLRFAQYDSVAQDEAAQGHVAPDDRVVLWLLVLACLSVAVGIWRYSLIALGTDQGRLLFPALASIVTLFVVGLSAWVPPRWQPLGGGLLISLSLALGIFGIAGVIRPAFAPPPAPTAAELAALDPLEPILVGELALIGWRLDGQPVLYWRAEAAPAHDYRTILRITAEDGALVWEWRRSPGYGRWSTDHWPMGAVVRDAYTVVWPDWAGPGRYRVEIAVQRFGADPLLPMMAGEPVAAPAHPYLFLGWLQR
jgi:hypothetical protein